MGETGTSLSDRRRTARPLGLVTATLLLVEFAVQFVLAAMAAGLWQQGAW